MELPTWINLGASVVPEAKPNWVEITALIVAILAFLAAAASAIFTWIQHKDAQSEIKEAQAQTRHAGDQVEQARLQSEYAARQLELAEELRKDQVQPYLLVEIDSSLREAQLLVVRISNAGMTAAHNVRASVRPRLTFPSGERISEFHISTLAPGGVWERMIDTTHKYFSTEDTPRSFTVSVEGDGVFGRVVTEQYTINLDDLAPKLLRDTEGVRVAKALEEVEGHLQGLSDSSAWWMARQVANDESGRPRA